MKPRLKLFSFLAGLALCWTSPALAQSEVDPASIEKISQIIRWSGVLTSVFVILGAWIVLRFARRFVEGLSDQFPARRLTLQKLSTIFQFLLYVVVIIIVLVLSLRLDKNVLAIIGGTAAVSIGFAIKDLVASFIAGIIIMWDRPFQVGDRVSFGGEYGDITAIGLRSVRMQTLNDNVVTIPNNKFLNDITSCGNYGALEMQVVMDFYVGVDQDIGKARDIVKEAALTSRYVHLPKPVVVLVTQQIQDNYIAVRLRLKAYVLDTKHEKTFETDVHLRVMEAFRESAILPPAILHRTSATKQAAI
ncbi:MAG: mechanosensitive ion channel family protein [Myxococcales bacterium]|nr:mechanosensitive ion channel family protein [Myxococcales bacterium]